MSFDSLERSQWEGRKVYTYTWARGGNVYRYTNADQDLVLQFQTYKASGTIRHGPIEQGGDPIRSPADVTVESDHPVAQLFRSTPPIDTVLLTIREVQMDDPADRRAVWQGRVTSAAFDYETREATLTHEPTYTSLQRMGLRRAYQRLCPLLTGGRRCGVNMEAFAIEVTAQEVNGLQLIVSSVAGRPDGWFLGGFIVYEITPGVVDRRPIRDHVGTQFTLTNFPVGLAAGMKLKAYPGDDHTITTCATKFNNVANYGGFPYFPEKNPFGGAPIY